MRYTGFLLNAGVQLYEKEVLSAGKVVLDFYSTECPPCEALASKYEHDKWGYIQVDGMMRTNIKDVFAAGDVASKPIRQITVTTTDGTIAAIQAAKELEQGKE